MWLKFANMAMKKFFSGETTRMNLVQSINNALDIALSTDPTAGKNLVNRFSVLAVVKHLMFFANECIN